MLCVPRSLIIALGLLLVWLLKFGLRFGFQTGLHSSDWLFTSDLGFIFGLILDLTLGLTLDLISLFMGFNWGLILWLTLVGYQFWPSISISWDLKLKLVGHLDLFVFNIDFLLVGYQLRSISLIFINLKLKLIGYHFGSVFKIDYRLVGLFLLTGLLDWQVHFVVMAAFHSLWLFIIMSALLELVLILTTSSICFYRADLKLPTTVMYLVELNWVQVSSVAFSWIELSWFELNWDYLNGV